jgi:hypothetical protein
MTGLQPELLHQHECLLSRKNSFSTPYVSSQQNQVLPDELRIVEVRNW